VTDARFVRHGDSFQAPDRIQADLEVVSNYREILAVFRENLAVFFQMLSVFLLMLSVFFLMLAVFLLMLAVFLQHQLHRLGQCFVTLR